MAVINSHLLIKAVKLPKGVDCFKMLIFISLGALRGLDGHGHVKTVLISFKEVLLIKIQKIIQILMVNFMDFPPKL